MIFTTEIQDSSIKHGSLKSLEGCLVFVEVNKYYPKRSIQSNRYYWAVLNNLVERISEHTGYTTEELHYTFKDMFLKKDFTNVITGEIKQGVQSTAKLNSKEFSDFVEKVIRFSAEKFGITILTPEEFYET